MSRGRLVIALIVAVISILGYYGSSVLNPVTQEKQHVAGITPEQEVALGLQAAPEMAQQFGGEDPDPQAQALVDKVGERVVAQSAAAQTPYRYRLPRSERPRNHQRVCAAGRAGVHHRRAAQAAKTEGQLAGVLGHEVGHVVARHGAEHIAKEQLTQGLTGAAVLATYDPSDPSSRNSAAVAAMIGQLVTMRFGRQDELEADKLGVRFSSESKYDPRSMIALMKILEESSQGNAPPEFFSTHRIRRTGFRRFRPRSRKSFPNGVPAGFNSEVGRSGGRPWSKYLIPSECKRTWTPRPSLETRSRSSLRSG